ncbi:MAG: glycosyltransferase family 4 protein [Anaerolineaceae bacterium]|nr:glycosyltransferase family 4 protein [Anaerolineaceae bacterium]
MHILLIHQAFAALNEPGGTRHHEFATFLAQQGHQVTILASPVSYLTGTSQEMKTPWKQEETTNHPNIRILRCYTYKQLHKSFVHRVFSFFSFMCSSFWIGMGIKHVDLVWGTSPPLFQAPSAWLIARLRRTPFLLEIRDLWPAFAVAVGILKSNLLIRLSQWLEKFLYRRADCVVVNSPGYIQHVTQHGAKRVELVPNGADPTMFTPAERSEAFRAELGLTDKFVVLYAGAHGMSNDLSIVLEAADQLRANQQIHFLFVGDGKEKTSLLQIAEDKQLENLTFLPPIPKNEIARVFAAADACVAILKPIDLYKTTYPNKVFDYMAAGRPVVLAIDGVIREVVETARAGLFAQPGNPPRLAEQVLYLCQHPDQAREMGLNGRKYITDNYDRHSQAQSMQEIMLSMQKRK